MELQGRLETARNGYGEDTVAWAETQAQLLRARRFESLDIENIAEEIEDLAKNDRRKLRSHISIIIEHLLKLMFSPAIEPRRGWRESIVVARAEIEHVLEDSPSLRRELSGMIEREFGRTQSITATKLRLYSEVATADGAEAAAPLEAEQILGDWLPA